jgi:hypothetical protein
VVAQYLANPVERKDPWVKTLFVAEALDAKKRNLAANTKITPNNEKIILEEFKNNLSTMAVANVTRTVHTELTEALQLGVLTRRDLAPGISLYFYIIHGVSKQQNINID